MTEPNILLIVLDSVRASNTSLYDYNNKTTPNLEEFHNNHGTLFRNCWAPSTWSLPSHTSMFTGVHAEYHGVDSEKTKLQPNKSIFYQLSESGYETGLFSHNVWLTDMNVGLKNGFDSIVDSNYLPYPDGLSPLFFDNKDFNGSYRKYADYLRESFRHKHTFGSLMNGVFSKTSSSYPRINSLLFNEDRSGFTYKDEFINWIESRDEKWAACINLMDAHAPYKPDERYDNWSDEEAKNIRDSIDDLWKFHTNEVKWWKLKALESLYDGSIRQADQVVSEIIDGLKKHEEFDNTYIVITADHGEGFGEYNPVSDLRAVGHKPNITESLLRVPLLIKEPDQDQSFTITEPASLTGYSRSVKNVQQDESVPESFHYKPVIASYTGMMESNKKGALEHLDNVDKFDKNSRVVYKTEDNHNIVKFMTWGDSSGKRFIKSSDFDMSESVGDMIAENFSEQKQENLQSDEKSTGIDDSVEDRLKRLGYR